VFICAAPVMAIVVRTSARRVESRLSDFTGLRFASASAQVLSYVVAFILYAHLVPELRALGTALLAGSVSFLLFWDLLLRTHLGILLQDCRWCSTGRFESVTRLG